MASPQTPIMASLLFSFLFISVALTSATAMFTFNSDMRTETKVKAMFEAWMLRQGKVYNSLLEREKRFEIFKDNLKFIDERNAMNLTYKLGLTRFADLTNEEYRSRYLTRFDESFGSLKPSDRYAVQEGEILQQSIDWRQRGAVLPYVKYQGQCGSCWTFSAACAIEAINAIVTGQLISLSEQQILDCSTGSYGCNGGFVEKAFEYVIKDPLDTEDNYPYQGFQTQCNPNHNRVVSIQGYEMVPRFNERALQKALTYQPISVTIEAGGWDFQHYRSGIFTGSCGNSLDHAVVAVGYGSANGWDYWIVRNSYGSNWGENGYVRMQRNVGNAAGMCGIAMRCSYPTKTGQPMPNLEMKVSSV